MTINTKYSIGDMKFTMYDNKVVQEKDEKPDRFQEVEKRFNYNATELINKYKATFGFATSGSGITSRSELYSTTLTNSVKTTATLVKDKKIIDQMLGLVIRNGRVDHEDGGHDDLVIGFLLSYWLMTQGKNLHYYNIPIKDILINNHVTKTISNNDDRYEAIRQKQVQEEITDLVETIQAEKNDYLIFKYENRLKKLASELNSEEAIHSIDKLIENLRESKKINRKINNGFRGYSNF